MNNGINLYALTRIQNNDLFNKSERIYSNRNITSNTQQHEQNSLISFVGFLIENGLALDCLDNFFFSYTIPQIGKEFDLLKLNDNIAVCIELKSQSVDEEKIKKQLIKDTYYLRVLLPREISCFAYVADTNVLYKLDNDNLVVSTVNELIECIQKSSIAPYHCIDQLFKVSQFLISPLNTPERFYESEYFLTSQQEEIKKEIKSDMEIPLVTNYYCITGNAGTGKTLLIYDIAKELSAEYKCLIVHCGKLPSQINQLREHFVNTKIITAQEVTSVELSEFDYIFIDESQRMYKSTFDYLIQQVGTLRKQLIICCDENQVLSSKEISANIQGAISSLPRSKHYRLTDKIRTNKSIASFINCMFNLNKPYVDLGEQRVTVCYSSTVNETRNLINYYKSKDYYFINFSQSNYHYGPYKQFFEQDFDTHHVIGQEFDNVLVVVDSSFVYNDSGELIATVHPNPDYQYIKLLYQAVTRVREKLCIIVYDNADLFEKLMSIFSKNDG